MALGCVRLRTLPQYCAVVTKSGNLNFLEPSGPVQTCNGTAFNFYPPVVSFMRYGYSNQLSEARTANHCHHANKNQQRAVTEDRKSGQQRLQHFRRLYREVVHRTPVL